MNKHNIESPCIRHCCLNDEDVCVGCFRSLSEIAKWSRASEAGKRIILANADNRKRLQIPPG